jgi:hypothetical protein
MGAKKGECKSIHNMKYLGRNCQLNRSDESSKRDKQNRKPNRQKKAEWVNES